METKNSTTISIRDYHIFLLVLMYICNIFSFFVSCNLISVPIFSLKKIKIIAIRRRRRRSRWEISIDMKSINICAAQSNIICVFFSKIQRNTNDIRHNNSTHLFSFPSHSNRGKKKLKKEIYKKSTVIRTLIHTKKK